MNFIVCVAENWGIGRGGRLLFDIPEDMAYFRRTTTGKSVVMGDVTLASLPGGRPLKNRDNIVLSIDPDYTAEGCTVCHGLGELAEALESRNTDEVFVIGGATIYRLLLPYCRLAYITRVDKAPQADAFIPDIELMDNWRLISRSEPHHHDGMEFTFDIYENSAPQQLTVREP